MSILPPQNSETLKHSILSSQSSSSTSSSLARKKRKASPSNYRNVEAIVFKLSNDAVKVIQMPNEDGVSESSLKQSSESNSDASNVLYGAVSLSGLSDTPRKRSSRLAAEAANYRLSSYDHEEAKTRSSSLSEGMESLASPQMSWRQPSSKFVPKISNSKSTCQSCRHKTRRCCKMAINLHLHDDPFYCESALRPSLNQLNGLSNISGTTYAEHGIGANGLHYVSVKPSTAQIPVEYVTLCQVCAGRFNLHRFLCDECYYVPKIDEVGLRDCVRCFEGVVSRH
jgi:hypothetical protein